MTETSAMTGNANSNGEASRHSETSIIAKWVLVVSGGGIAVTSVCAIWASSRIDDPDNLYATSQAIFNALLPLLGTWVGTVLAFYFSKQNFTAASESVQRMVELTADQKLVSYSVESKMLPVSQITTFQIPAGKAPKDVLLSDLRSKDGGKITRLPITDSAGVVMYVVHQSMLFRFIADNVLMKTGADVTKLSLRLADERRHRSLVEGIDAMS